MLFWGDIDAPVSLKQLLDPFERVFSSNGDISVHRMWEIYQISVSIDPHPSSTQFQTKPRLPEPPMMTMKSWRECREVQGPQFSLTAASGVPVVEDAPPAVMLQCLLKHMLKHNNQHIDRLHRVHIAFVLKYLLY